MCELREKTKLLNIYAKYFSILVTGLKKRDPIERVINNLE